MYGKICTLRQALFMKLVRDTPWLIHLLLVLLMSSCSDFQQDNKNLTTNSTEIDQASTIIDKLSKLPEEHQTFCRAVYKLRNDSLIWFSDNSPESDSYYQNLKNDTLLAIPFGYLPINHRNFADESTVSKELFTLLKTSYYINARERGIFDLKKDVIFDPKLTSAEHIIEFIAGKSKKETWTQHLFNFTAKRSRIKSYHTSLRSFFSKHPVTKPSWSTPEALQSSDSIVEERLANLGFEDDSTGFLKQLKQFQWLHGLNADGIVGKHTKEALIITNRERYNRAIIGLDNYYQMKDSIFPEQYIKVNIPAFELSFIHLDSIHYKSTVVVGRKKTATPTFQAPLKYIVINPYWHLPHSIASKETLYKIKKDSAIIAKKGYEIIHKNKPIQVDTINWEAYNQYNFPYRIRQRPGPKNSLGNIKFIFPNRYNVYIHDTPQRSLFTKERKTYSHGCIRLQSPTTLAQEILKCQEHTYRDSLDTLFNKTKETYLRIHDDLPVIIDYQTVTYDDSAKTPRFYYDVYQRDSLLLQKVKRKFN
mgnify:CR=1 FL=1